MAARGGSGRRRGRGGGQGGKEGGREGGGKGGREGRSAGLERDGADRARGLRQGVPGPSEQPIRRLAGAGGGGGGREGAPRAAVCPEGAGQGGSDAAEPDRADVERARALGHPPASLPRPPPLRVQHLPTPLPGPGVLPGRGPVHVDEEGGPDGGGRGAGVCSGDGAGPGLLARPRGALPGPEARERADGAGRAPEARRPGLGPPLRQRPSFAGGGEGKGGGGRRGRGGGREGGREGRRERGREDLFVSHHGLIRCPAPATLYRSHSFCGTHEYLAPEVLLNQGHSLPVDWWCLGLCLHEMLTRRHPFKPLPPPSLPPSPAPSPSSPASSPPACPGEVMRNICGFPPFLHPSLSSDAAALLVRLLEKDPDRRLGGVAALRQQPFFKNLNWEAVYEKRVEAPYRPRVRSDEDVGCFAGCLTEERVRYSDVVASEDGWVRGKGEEGREGEREGGGCLLPVWPRGRGRGECQGWSWRGRKTRREEEEEGMWEGFEYVAEEG
ncbi:rps6ka4 protein [Nannochloropsis gaditana]|uniref:Rps6ka4 protein n=1 Tax=Nannochloropsis gaditana TaxID=72520 RepID=W7T486_9STRA|nr:rps6ka4 protein [Nannochloropsis gaditana]